MSTATPSGGTRSRENTKARLIAAGRTLFLSRDLTEVSVDLIAREAGLSRAAFYLHFNGRDELLAAMMIAESYHLFPAYRWFKDHPPSPANIELFIRRRAAADVSSRIGKFFYLAALQSDTARAAFQDNRIRLMGVLSEHFRAFRPPADDSEPELRRSAEAMIAMVAVEQLSIRERELQQPAIFEQMILQVVQMWVSLSNRYPG